VTIRIVVFKNIKTTTTVIQIRDKIIKDCILLGASEQSRANFIRIQIRYNCYIMQYYNH